MIFRWWMPLVIGVGISATANAVLICTSLRVRPEKVVDKPYADSAFEDDRAAERASFSKHGWSVRADVDGASAVFTVTVGEGERPGSAMVQLYRPNDRAADRRIPWPDPRVPLRCDLPKPGVWNVHVVLYDASGALMAHDIRVTRP